MRWEVKLIETHDGGEPDEKYAKGIILTDRRSGTFDLIAMANDRWRTKPLEGEVYEITPLRDTTRYRVGPYGSTRPLLEV